MDFSSSKKIQISGTFKYQPRAATPIPKSVKWFANKLERKVEKEAAAKESQESTSTSDLHLRTFFSDGSSSKMSGLNGLFSSDSTVSQPNKTVSLHPSALFSNGNSDSTPTVPSSMDVSAQTSWILVDGKSTSDLHLLLKQLSMVTEQLEAVASLLAKPTVDKKSERSVNVEKSDQLTDISVLRLAAAESADGREFIGKLGANGSLSSYVKLLELIADDYVRLQQTLSINHQ
ncbi:hypothetical protein M3Y95_00879200 [Aphelenchoides besseyi]|nr:hypothetical protein M3Y95_00879200 [Aphelenchoides besseyi]